MTDAPPSDLRQLESVVENTGRSRVAVQAGGDDSREQPGALWEEAVEEGEQRLGRSLAGEAVTGLLGGLEVMLGVLAAAAVAGALSLSVSTQLAEIGGSLAFGVGFVLITIGRSELFTENFLIPVAAVFAGRRPPSRLARTWGTTLITNLLGLFVLAVIFSTATVVDHHATKAAGHVADVLASRTVGGAFLSAVVAGMVMTLWTWLNLAARTDIARVAIALVIGFLVAAPVLNHVVVGTGEMMLGVLSGTSHAGWGDVWANFGLALLGNLCGGIALVTVTRLVQARGQDPGG